ncbi:MAG: transporter substrate-binding domain-containing protein [Treponema sp.]|jgi:signal transduction histidine kinase/ActR/RegA family two-component response regulator|nr:transporter substrate-binding domain-containing protein [Treponema sp.]
MLKINRKASTALVIIVMTAVFSACDIKVTPVVTAPQSPFTSFRDIPGITAEEIAGIEALQKKYKSFSYGMTLSTEAFPTGNGAGGYSAMLCEWLTGLTGIQFHPAVYLWSDLVEKLNAGELDFAGNITPTEERIERYYMSAPIAERQYKTIQLAGSLPLDRIALTRPLRYVFLEGTAFSAAVASVTDSSTYETIFVSNYEDAYRILKNGTADAFIGDSAVASAFDIYGDMYTSNFLPLIFSSVSMTTAKAELQPVISLVTKALQNGASPYLNYLYNKGYEAYKKNKFFTQLSEEEKAYLKNTSSVPLAARYFNYPVDFYNTHEKKWEGIVFDVLAEVEELTGLKFEVANKTDTELSDLFNMVYDGRAHIMPELIYSERRAQYVIWTKHIFLTDQLALLSKSAYPNVSANEIPNKRVGVIANTVRAEMFRRWFPNAENIIEYATDENAMHALEQDKIDLVMSSKNRLLSFLNFQEISLFKANYLFNYPYESTFGFHKDQTLLCTIMDKALPLVDTHMITEQWLTKTYDYRTRLMKAQRPWLIGATALSLAVLLLILILFFRNRSEGKRLAKLVEVRTKEVRNASEAKSRFIANMSHEMRTPMNAIVGLTDLMLEEETPGVVKETLKKINTAGNTLMELINDVLDISKIEAGKLDLTPVKYDMASLLNEILAINMIRIKEKPITFKLDINKDMPRTFFGDDLRVKQVLNNLLSNAFKYTKEGNVTLGINCQHEGTPDGTGNDIWVSFYISDSGIGIREEDIPKLFTDYNQVNIQTNRKIEGTGLGLSITKKFVEMMDGEISVESEYGKGSTFRVLIRQGLVAGETVGKETAENLSSLRYSDNKKHTHEKLVRPDLSYARALVVDDFPTNLDVAAGMLRKYKMQVDCINNGQKAIELIATGEPLYNVIFMDHMMSEMDGIEATKAIRALGTEYAKNIPVIALTGNAVNGTEQMFLDNGFDAFLSKPLNMMSLDSVVQQWIKKNAQ